MVHHEVKTVEKLFFINFTVSIPIHEGHELRDLQVSYGGGSAHPSVNILDNLANFLLAQEPPLVDVIFIEDGLSCEGKFVNIRFLRHTRMKYML